MVCWIGIDRSDREFLFVVTYGRSGSTLVMGVLNSITGFSICGENDCACEELFGFYKKFDRSICSFENNVMPLDSRNSWFQTLSRSGLKSVCQDFLWSLFSGSGSDRVVGFKEIRWDKPFFEDLVLWLNIVCGRCRFLVVTRNLDDTCRSAWHAGSPSCRERLKAFEDRVFGFFGSHSYIDSFFLHFDDLYGVSVDSFRDLFVWLGVDLDEGAVQAVLDRKHSYAGGVKKF